MGVAALTASCTVVISVGSGDSRGHCVQPRKPRDALDEEAGPSDLHLLKLTDYRALCLGARAVCLEVPAELYAAREWRVLCAGR